MGPNSLPVQLLLQYNKSLQNVEAENNNNPVITSDCFCGEGSIHLIGSELESFMQLQSDSYWSWTMVGCSRKSWLSIYLSVQFQCFFMWRINISQFLTMWQSQGCFIAYRVSESFKSDYSIKQGRSCISVQDLASEILLHYN